MERIKMENKNFSTAAVEYWKMNRKKPPEGGFFLSASDGHKALIFADAASLYR